MRKRESRGRGRGWRGGAHVWLWEGSLAVLFLLGDRTGEGGGGGGGGWEQKNKMVKWFRKVISLPSPDMKKTGSARIQSTGKR